jgi:NAD(P)-dependent dehydrogenase (short-subunit alcohol dehydrogenase family)
MSERVAVVTGGAHGIGRAVVRRLVGDGWRVIFLDSDPAGADEVARETGAVAVVGDVATEQGVATAVAAAGRLGRLDLLVNNAGISDFRPLDAADLDHWNRVLAVNLTGPFLMARACAPLLGQSGGAIVNIASSRAVMSEAGTEAYSASKGGLVALTHALAISLGPDVRVNCIGPGWIDVAGAPLSPQDHRQHPVGRVGVPEDVAALVAWLAGPEAGFMTGANLPLDGGMTRKMIYAL